MKEVQKNKVFNTLKEFLIYIFRKTFQCSANLGFKQWTKRLRATFYFHHYFPNTSFLCGLVK